MAYYFKDLTGQKYGRLTVIKRIENRIYNSGRSVIQWLCRCDCGNKNVYVTTNSLRNGSTRSCGCLAKETSSKSIIKISTKHGKSKTRLFNIWSAMKDRCYNKKHIAYLRYGGRGIKICNKWLNSNNGFINFYNWVLENGYKDYLTIDRIDNNGNYEPNNCRWATHLEQQKNQDKTIKITINDEEKTMHEWSEISGIKHSIIYWRYKNNWPVEKLFENPRELYRANKKSGIKGIIWMEKSQKWHVKGFKDGQKNKYIKSFTFLDDAIQFKKEYDLKNPFLEIK